MGFHIAFLEITTVGREDTDCAFLSISGGHSLCSGFLLIDDGLILLVDLRFEVLSPVLVGWGECG